MSSWTDCFLDIFDVMVFFEPAGGIDSWRIGQTGKNEDDIAGPGDGEQSRKRVGTVKSAEGKEQGVEQLGNECGAIVAQPKIAASVTGKFGAPLPPAMVKPDVKALNNGVDNQAGEHHPGCVGKNSLDVWKGPVAAIRCIQQPGLGNDDKHKRGYNTDINGPGGFLAAGNFA